MPDITLPPLTPPEPEPESTSPTSTGSSPELTDDDELTRLFDEAQRAATVPVTDHPKPCIHISTTSVDVVCPKKCSTCLWFFCPQCASPLDPKYCRLCLSEPNAELIELPLTDTEGITHAGRVLHPAEGAVFFQPRFGTLAKSISEMSMHELESHIDYYKDLVRQAERALDFRRVVLGTSQMELQQRKDIERRHLAADKTRYPVKVASTTKSGKTVTKSASLADMSKMLAALAALNKLKQDQKK